MYADEWRKKHEIHAPYTYGGMDGWFLRKGQKALFLSTTLETVRFSPKYFLRPLHCVFLYNP